VTCSKRVRLIGKVSEAPSKRTHCDPYHSTMMDAACKLWRRCYR
jgi:hypothetical protein